MNLTINGKAVKRRTLLLFGMLAAGAATSQVTTVNHFLSYHPRLAPLGGFLVSIIMLAHEPFVAQWLSQQNQQDKETKQ